MYITKVNDTKVNDADWFDPWETATAASADGALPPLAPFYYLKNFERVLTAILARYADLLLPEEMGFLTEFPHVPLKSRALLARLVMRSGSLFRSSKINYSEIGDTQAAAAPLIEAGWLCDHPPLDIEQLQGMLTKAELIRCMKLPQRYGERLKSGLVAMLKAQYVTSRPFCKWCRGSEDIVYELRIKPTCDRFSLMFFGNDRQTWAEFVTADLRIFNYEKVERPLDSRPFQTRAQIEVFMRLQECSEWLEKGIPLDELVRFIPEVIEDSDWLEDSRQNLRFCTAREYERAGETDKALAIYADCTHRGARTRAMRLKSRLNDWEGVRALCFVAKENPESAAELQYVRRVLPRLRREQGLAGDDDAASPVISKFEIVLEGSPRPGSVEYHVRDHLARDLTDGSTVRYVENGLINALFGLLCWPAIFAPIRGAFFHDFHFGPADLKSVHFHQRRRREFDECLSQLDQGGYRRAIRKIFREKWGIRSPFVRWHALDKTLLDWALDCFPSEHLRAWFEWIIRDIAQNRAGFPDLVQFWPDERKYRLIEVKGPGDRIQDNQKRLLEYCTLHRMPVSVCHVRWSQPSLARG